MIKNEIVFNIWKSTMTKMARIETEIKIEKSIIADEDVHENL